MRLAQAPCVKAVRWLSLLASLAAAGPAPAGDAELEAAVRALRDGVADPAICSGTLCPRVLPTLDRALAALPLQRPSLALSYASSALLLLERYKLVAGGLEPVIDELLLRAQERVLESRAQAETRIEALCSGVRPVSRRGLVAPQRYLDTAAVQGTKGQSAMELRWLGLALTSYESAMRLAAVLQTRCRPPACRVNGWFSPGDPANVPIELVPPDRGTVVDYTGTDLGESEDFSARIVYLGLSSLRVIQVFGPAGDPSRLESRATLGSCRDASGWDRRTTLSESAILRHVASGASQRFSLSLRASRPVPAFPGLSFTLSGSAPSMRVGDRISEPGVAVAVRVYPGGAGTSYCDFEQQVTAIETRTVPAGTFETAKVEFQMSCDGEPPERSTSWIASEVGEIESESYDPSGATIVRAQAVCFETPDTPPGRCGSF